MYWILVQAVSDDEPTRTHLIAMLTSFRDHGADFSSSQVYT